MRTKRNATGVGALTGVLVLTVTLAPAAARAAAADEVEVKAADGRLFATIVFCNDCRNGKGRGPCDQGAEVGWYRGKPCGQCFLKANHNVLIRYPYDIHIVGRLVDAKGQPVKERFVKLFLPNGWGVRTRTLEDGTFRLMLGATADREEKTPLVVDVGARVDSIRDPDPHFALYMLPPSYVPCSPADAPAEAAAGQKKGAKKR